MMNDIGLPFDLTFMCLILIYDCIAKELIDDVFGIEILTDVYTCVA